MEVVKVGSTLKAASLQVEVVPGNSVVPSSPKIRRDKIQPPRVEGRLKQVVMYLFKNRMVTKGKGAQRVSLPIQRRYHQNFEWNQ